jgi:hypothetical protein
LEIDGIGPAPHFVARNVDGVAPIEKPWPSATFAGLHDELLGWVRR